MGKVYSITLTQPQVIEMILEKMRDQYGRSLWSKIRWILKRILFFLRSWFFDLEYHTIPIDLLKEALEVWKKEVLSKMHYMGEVWDCDDFARHFEVWLKDYIAGNGIIDKHTQTPVPVFNGDGDVKGILYDQEGVALGGHMWNLVLVTLEDGTPDVVFVEPQIGEIIEGNRSPDGYIYEMLAVSV